MNEEKKRHPIIDDDCLTAFLYWVEERDSITAKKKAGEPKPWTEDKLLANYRFVNTHREDDRQTQCLIKNIINNEKLTIRDKVVNIILFRYWGLWETMNLFGGAWTRKELMTAEPYRYAAEKYKEITASGKKHPFFTSAFYTSGVRVGVRKELNINSSVTGAFILAQRAIRDKTPERVIKAPDEESSMKVFKELPGVASTLAYQMWVDCTYIPEFPFSADNFVVVSPKTKNILSRLFKDRDGMSLEESLFWLRDNLNLNLSVMNIEHSLSGFSDYYKAIIDNSRPKRRYK